MDKRVNDKNLEDLLKKSFSEASDDFEKEALEGFNSLGSAEEALELKSELDQRIHSEVFERKNSGNKIYWYAAAGLLLLIGSSVFFFLQNNNLSENKTDLAIVQEELKPKEKENTITPVPAENIPTQTEEISKSEAPKKESSGKDKTPAYGPGTSAAGNSSNNRSAALKDNSQFDTRQPESTTALAEQDQEKSDKKADDYKTLESEKPASKAAEIQQAPAKEETESKVRFADELKSEGKKKTNDSRKKAAQAPGSSNEEAANSYAWTSDASKPNKQQDNNAKNEAAHGGYVNNKNSVAQKREEKDQQANEKTLSAPASANASGAAADYDSNRQCYYRGGETELHKELNQKLTEKNLSKKFDAVLFINDKKEIEKVVFTKLFDLKKDDETHIAEVLKTLNKFYFSGSETANKEFEFKIRYRP